MESANFNTCPESPDGKRVLFFSSTTRDAHDGEIRVLDRATGDERVLAKNIRVEDAHRVACQQWVSNGHRVVFHGGREYHIPDFSNWKAHDPFGSAFADLLRDLRAQAQ